MSVDDGGYTHLTGTVLLSPTLTVRDVYLQAGRFTFARPAGSPGRVIEGWVLPGLVDAHCHVGLDRRGLVPDSLAEEQALQDRDAGTLLIRDAGVVNDTRWIQQRDDLPRLVRAGRHVARTGRYFRDYAVEVEPEGLAAAVAEQARRGDGWVKIVGDWIDRSVGDLMPAFPPAALSDAVAAAHAEGARVTAHCFAADTLDAMLDAGIDCIEHATGMLPRHIPRFVEQGVAIVPTLINIDTFPAIAAGAAGKYPDYAAHMRALWGGRHAMVRRAFDAGVPVFAGTDAGSVIAHGRLPDEIAALATAGLGPVAALDAACWSARTWLGFPGIEEGASADAVVCAEDPRLDVGTLAAPHAVVLRGGVVAGRCAE
ncbi:amidohydrolase family protein [Arthrobacter agilis]|uniref:amidohydrolase family protein n=1 Tax=Arthrobacter agilis TaxID=37921 RepID=UPI000B3543CA|nr:amidohydrolase family protein [Arthrobacter agilis]OUM44818.1 amidohydrolase [Arthrobacter agilis]PPB47142.1 amidohydrolase [Arthrobacter agilis]TPV22556.1 amidohydrolase family protein [Arthrobacter agilis]VDR32381.1 Amidohydrolase family [Arthrobacter agilis]